MADQGYYFLPHNRFNDLLSSLQRSGYQCVGPQVIDGAIVYKTMQNAEQLPWGVHEIQDPGRYKLTMTTKKKAFAWANGPEAIKPLLFKSREVLWQVKRDDQGKLTFISDDVQSNPVAIIGARPCDLEAMAIQDKIFTQDKFIDQRYQARRKNLFVVAVNCTHPSANCFCVSAGGSTKATQHFDVAMTEISSGFVVNSGSDKGAALLSQLNLKPASFIQKANAESRLKSAAKKQTKHVPQGNLKEKLFSNLDHSRWDEVAARCLSCGSCTQVCPTCFCHSEYDQPVLDGTHSQHLRQWDSCFTEGHSYIVGHVVRKETKTRYRQWLTHKFGSWHDQFGMSGCVGCGRCITWCPAGIDITEEVTAICSDKKHKTKQQ